MKNKIIIDKKINIKKTANMLFNTLLFLSTIIVTIFAICAIQSYSKLDILQQATDRIASSYEQDIQMLKQCKFNEGQVIENGDIDCYNSNLSQVRSYKMIMKLEDVIDKTLKEYKDRTLPDNIRTLKNNYIKAVEKQKGYLETEYNQSYGLSLSTMKEMWVIDMFCFINKKARTNQELLNKELSKEKMIKRLDEIVKKVEIE